MNREAIYSALFTLVTSVTGLKSSGRLLKHWSDVAPADQPALFQVQKTENGQRISGFPTKWLLSVELYLYVRADPNDKDNPPAKSINQILDAIEQKLESAFPASGVQTLGGLVTYCRIEGTIETDEGKLGEQSVVIIPIQILAT
jgi:hypothetical protein